MKYWLAILILISFCSSAFSKQIKIQGRIYNKVTLKGLSYANIRALNTVIGISANIDGEFEINLEPGRYTIVSSYIGYKSDTLTVTVDSDKNGIDFFLTPVPISLPDITVMPGINPAIEVIAKAIESKEKRAEVLRSYEFEAYTKGVIRANNDLGFGSSSFKLGLSKVKESADLITKGGDSVKMKIKGIFENESKGYYKEPDNCKEIITARKTSSNLPPSIGALTGGRLVQNFYSDNLRFFDRQLPGPLAKNALKYYYFRIQDTLVFDNQKVYRIYFEPEKETDPGFKGFVYILDSTYSLIKVDADLNRAANTGGLFEKVNILQQFLPFAGGTYMPVDYRIFIKASLLGIAKAGFELSSIMYNYKINENIDSDFFDKAVLTIMPGADSKDSTYWKNIQSIPNTLEELTAYRQIDSIRTAPKDFWETLYSNVVSGQYELSNNFSISGPFGIYQYNHVEGHTLYFSASGRNLFDKRLDTRLTLSNGFSDKRFKGRIAANYSFGNYRTYKFSFSAFNRLATLFSTSDVYSSFTSTILALWSRRDFRNYYYTKGFDVNFEGEVTPVLSLNAGFSNHTDNSASVNSDFSLFGRGRSNSSRNSNYYLTPIDTSNHNLIENVPIFETRINAVNLGFNFDFRNYIEDGYFRRRISQGNSFATFGAGVVISNSKFLKSAIDFISYSFNLQGVLNTFNSANLGFRLTGVYSNGPVPYQMQYALPGNLSGTSKNFTFRTVGISNMFGDQALTLNVEHNFKNELFRFLRIPFLMNFQLNSFFNAGWKNMSERSAAIMPVNFSILDRPLLETGFSIGHVLIPVNLEFAWRLTHREENRFKIGINTFIL